MKLRGGFLEPFVRSLEESRVIEAYLFCSAILRFEGCNSAIGSGFFWLRLLLRPISSDDVWQSSGAGGTQAWLVKFRQVNGPM